MIKNWYETYVVRNTRDFVGPDLFLLKGMVRVAVRQEMLEEAHVLETEKGDLVMRLLRASQFPFLSVDKSTLPRNRRNKVTCSIPDG